MSIASAPTPKDIPDVLLGQVAERFRALSSVSRLRILNALMPGPQSMSQVISLTGLTQSNLSRHARELELAGCIQRVREGKQVRLEIADPTLHALCELVCGSLVDRITHQQSQVTPD